MKHSVLVSSLWILAAGTAAQEDPAPELTLQKAEIRDGDRSVQAEYGQLTVPQFYDDPEAGELRLAVLVRRSTSSDPGPPTFFLNGIPDGATGVAAKEHWDAYLELGDLVFFDQRGSGRSSPQLTWERPPFRVEDFLSDRATALENLLDTAETIRAFTKVAGVDLSAFNTRESARDVDSLRRALGYETIRLIGHSAGSHLGFEVVRRFGDRIEGFASLGTCGPGEIHSLPSQIDDFLRTLSELAAKDERIGAEMPDLYGRLGGVLDAVQEDPVELSFPHPESGEDVVLHLGRQGLQFLLLMELGDPRELALFPRLVHELEQGKTDVLGWMARLRYGQLSSLPVLLFINRGASGASPERRERIRREAELSPFGMVRCFFSPELDRAFGIRDLGEAFREAVQSDVRTLFVSGTLDGKTPPRRAERARTGFSRSTHIVLENGGHNDVLHRPEVHARILRFLAWEELEDETISLPALEFALLEGEDPSIEHPALP